MNKKFAFSILFILAIFLSASFASQTYAQIVINEVYGGGGNSNAKFNRDFIELYCNGMVACDLNGYSVQYASAPLGNFTLLIAFTTSTVIQPGDYFLIAAGPAPGAGADGAALPTPNATVTSTTNLSATNGNVVLVNQTTQLAAGSCPDTTSAGAVGDKVAYGTGTCREGTVSAPVGSNTTSLQRFPNGTDTNNNNLDFVAAVPTPGNAGPTAASVSIEGRVTTVKGRGISRAQITLTDAEGNMRVAMPNAFGYYRFLDVAAGETYILSIRSKSHQFAEPTRVITVTEDLTGADFVAYW
jgi:hypothetical protein